MGPTLRATATRRDGGFTLVELLIVIAIIILMAALLIPSFIGFLEGRRLRAGASTIETLLLTAKSEAIRSRRMHYLVLDDFNQRVVLFDSGLNGRKEFNRVVGPEGTIEMQTGSDDREVPLDAAQSQLPRSVYFARTGTQPGVVATQLFSQVIACYPDGSIVLSRPDVPTALYLTKGRGGATYGGDVVLSLGDPEYAPGASAESERACFMDIKPTMGRVQFEIDTWERDYHTG